MILPMAAWIAEDTRLEKRSGGRINIGKAVGEVIWTQGDGNQAGAND